MSEPSPAAPDVGLEVRLAGWLGHWLIRGIRRTNRLRHHGDGAMRALEADGTPFIIAFWHRHLLLMPYCYRGGPISVLISRHGDGALIAEACRHFGFSVSRGSSTRGGVGAVREMLRRAREGWSLGVTPDGPKGPVGIVKPGVIQVAQRSGLPIQPVALAASRARRLRSWDRFLVPLPFGRVDFVYGELLRVARADDVDAAAAELARRIDRAGAEAERIAGARPAHDTEHE